ncbi:MAG: SH3 domain-containing protein [Chloroflexi bacterium]|nr:SH3 domain-containing protein [Chloroflexota bacterium]
MKTQILTLLLCCLLVIAACGGSGVEQRDDPGQGFAEASARRVNVFSQINGQENPLLPGQPTQLRVGDSLRVDEGGYAILRFSDLVSVEILHQGNLQVRELSLDEQSPLVAFGQSAGIFANELKPSQNGATRRLEIQSDFATITATGTRFLLVRELDTPLEWLWAIEAAEDDLTVSAQGLTRTATSGVAYWIAPIGPPSQPIDFDPVQATAWIDALRAGNFQGEVGDVLWKAADTVLHTGEIVGDVAPGAVVTLGDISIALAAEGAVGPAAYTRSDCNGDSIPDLAMTDGRLLFDLRAVAGRVRAVDLTVTSADGVDADSLSVFNPAYEILDHSPVIVERRNDSVLSVRSWADRDEEPYHYAELRLADGCFLGISLTPPETDGTSGAPRPAISEALCTVSAAGLNLRRGPGVAFAPPIRLLRQGDKLIPLGRTADRGWLRVQAADDGSEGWVSANPQFVVCAVAVGTLPVLSAPPTSVRQDAPTPTFPRVNPTPAARIWETPRLLEPADGTIFDAGSSVTLSWSAFPAAARGRGSGVAHFLPGVDTNLRDDEYYQVKILFSPSIDAVWSDVHLVKENSFVVPAYLNSREMTWDQRYVWSVSVVQRPSVGEVRLLSPESESRVFYWHLRQAPAPIPTLAGPATATPPPSLVPTPTATSGPTATPTETNTPTLTDVATATATPTDISTATATPTDIPAATATPTDIPAATATPTDISTATATPTDISTATATPTEPPRPSPTPTPTPLP